MLAQYHELLVLVGMVVMFWLELRLSLLELGQVRLRAHLLEEGLSSVSHHRL